MTKTTPTLHPRFASPGRRLAAFGLDILTLLPFWLLLPSAWPELYGMELASDQPQLMDLLVYLDTLLILAYFIFLLTHFQTTVGGKVMKIKVVKADGSRLTLADVVLRELATGLSFIVFSIGYLAMFWHPKRQTWHDRIANTYVIVTDADQPGTVKDES